MNKKEFEKKIGYRVSDKYHADAVRCLDATGGIDADAFFSEYAAYGDGSEIIARLVDRVEYLAEQIELRAEYEHSLESDAAILKTAAGAAKSRIEELEATASQASAFRQRAEAAEAELERLRNKADRGEAAPVYRHDEHPLAESAAWKDNSRRIKKRIKDIIETEILKYGWKAVSFQPSATLLGLLREELPECDVVAYLSRLKQKYSN